MVGKKASEGAVMRAQRLRIYRLVLQKFLLLQTIWYRLYRQQDTFLDGVHGSKITDSITM